MPHLKAELLVIGGGATGAASRGTRRCAASTSCSSTAPTSRRARAGASTACCTRAGATSSRTRSPPRSAWPRTRSCAASIPDCIEDTGGLFVTTPDDDPAYGDRFLAGCRARRAAGRGDRRRRGAAARAAPEPAHLARVHGPRRGDRRVEDRVGASRAAPRRTGRACSPTTGSSTCTARATPSPARACATSCTGEELDIEAGFTINAVRRVGGADRAHGRHRGRRRRARQGDHDRDEPPAREHGDQPLHDAGRRRHPRPDPDGQRDRDDRHPLGRPRRDPGHAGRGRRRCSTTASAWCPGFRDARALRVWAGVRPLFQDDQGRRGGRHARRQPHARGRRPPRARRRRRAAHDVRRQADDAAADGAGHRRRDVHAARRRSARAARTRSAPPGNEADEHYDARLAAARAASATCRTSS